MAPLQINLRYKKKVLNEITGECKFWLNGVDLPSSGILAYVSRSPVYCAPTLTDFDVGKKIIRSQLTNFEVPFDSLMTITILSGNQSRSESRNASAKLSAIKILKIMHVDKSYIEA